MTATQTTDAHRRCPEAMAELARVTRERNELLTWRDHQEAIEAKCESVVK